MPVDVTQSDWPSTIERREGQLLVRLGFNYVRGFRQQTALSIVAKRPFKSIDDLKQRGMFKDTLVIVARLPGELPRRIR